MDGVAVGETVGVAEGGGVPVGVTLGNGASGGIAVSLRSFSLLRFGFRERRHGSKLLGDRGSHRIRGTRRRAQAGNREH